MNLVIDGIRYHVETCGDGFPLLLLHGFTGDHSTWKPFFHKWGKHSSLLSLDIVGHGKTSSPEDVKKYEMMSVTRDIYLMLEKSGIEKVDILGYSMGGRLALSFAMNYPDKVRKLILESASPGLRTKEDRRARMEADNELAIQIRNKGLPWFVEYWENIPLFETQKRLPQVEQESIRSQRLTNSVVGLANSLVGMGTGAQPCWWEDLKSLSIDTLLITGSLDTKFCEIASNMKKMLPNCEWINVENTGHAIHVEECEKFGTIVSEFLSNT